MQNKTISWNENFWDKTQTKAIQGLCALGIIFHHMAQKTCAPWLPEAYVIHGLEPFLNLGFLFVGIFFFCSGYGLYKSIKSNPDYLKGFIGKHFRPIILLFIISNFCFYTVGQEFNHYSWFIFAILYLYFAFYISFKFCKKESAAIICLTVFIFAYIICCEILVAGTWCYNTIGIFLIGLLFAKYVDKITKFIRNKFWFSLIASIIILAVSFFASLKFNKFIYTTDKKSLYDLFRFLTVIVQFISSTAFSVIFFIINQRIKIQNKILLFLGSLSLELYLIHVLFVEIFSFAFVNPENKAICYISNLFLYIIAVLTTSILSAYGLFWIKKGAHYLYTKFDNIFAAMRRDFKKVCIGILIIFAATTGILIISNITKASALNEHINSYKEENITYIPLDDDNNSKISVYLTGEGTETIVILRGFYDPCPTLSQKALADEFSTDYKIVLIDFPGSGFSSDYKTERTVENICSEIHTVIQKLELTDYTILAEEISGLYALYYVNKYPDEVQKVITIDSEITSVLRAQIASQHSTIFEYNRYSKKTADYYYVLGRIINSLGYKTLVWPLWQPLFSLGTGQKDDEVACELFFKNYSNKSTRNERINEMQNYLDTENLTYPSEITVIDFVSEHRKKSFEKIDIDLYENLNNLCKNNSNHKIINLVDAIYCVTNNPKAIKNILMNK